MKKSDLVLIASPFLFTTLLLLGGYQLLISQTPQGRINLPQASSNIEILTDGEIEKYLPSNPVPNQIVMTIQPIPNNRAQLGQFIKLALDSGANAVYFSLPITIGPDNSFTLTNVDASSEENITRWAKKSITQAHQNGLHVVFALTLNATDTIKDYQAFNSNYNKFIVKWAKLATEYGVSFFNPGITLGHPLYTNLSFQQTAALIQSIQTNIRRHYSGNIGIGLCCSNNFEVQPRGYTFIMAIPTGEHPLDTLEPIVIQMANAQNMTHIFHYDRQNQRVVSINSPNFKPPR